MTISCHPASSLVRIRSDQGKTGFLTVGWAEPWLLNGTSCCSNEPTRLLYLLYLPFLCCFGDQVSRHVVHACQLGRALLKSSRLNLPFHCVAGTLYASTEVSMEGQPHRWDQAQVEQPGAVAQLPPLPLPPLWPPVTQNEKLRKQILGMEKKHMEGRCFAVSDTAFCLPLEKKEPLELFLIPHFLSPFKGLIHIPIASLLSTALVCFFSISGEGVFYLLYLKTPLIYKNSFPSSFISLLNCLPPPHPPAPHPLL